MDKKLWELINPSDKITFRATDVEAAIIEVRMREGPYFVKEYGTDNKPPELSEIDLRKAYDAIWKDRASISSHAAAFDSFLVGDKADREAFEKNVSFMSGQQVNNYRASYHGRKCTSLNDICQACWTVALKIAAFEPEKVSP